MHACYRSRRVSPQFVSHTSAVFRLSFVTCSVTSHLHVRGAVDHDRVKDFLRCGEVEGDQNALGKEGSEVARARGRAEVVACSFCAVPSNSTVPSGFTTTRMWCARARRAASMGSSHWLRSTGLRRQAGSARAVGRETLAAIFETHCLIIRLVACSGVCVPNCIYGLQYVALAVPCAPCSFDQKYWRIT